MMVFLSHPGSRMHVFILRWNQTSAGSLRAGICVDGVVFFWTVSHSHSRHRCLNNHAFNDRDFTVAVLAVCAMGRYVCLLSVYIIDSPEASHIHVPLRGLLENKECC